MRFTRVVDEMISRVVDDILLTHKQALTFFFNLVASCVVRFF
jgi:hypothetical protein